MAADYNIPSRSQRNNEVGLVWEEKFTGGQGTIEVPKYSAIRVRAGGATTVTIAGVLAATMSSGEIMVFNAGVGDLKDNKRTVTLTIAGANAWVQVGREFERRPEGLSGY